MLPSKEYLRKEGSKHLLITRFWLYDASNACSPPLRLLPDRFSSRALFASNFRVSSEGSVSCVSERPEEQPIVKFKPRSPNNTAEPEEDFVVRGLDKNQNRRQERTDQASGDEAEVTDKLLPNTIVNEETRGHFSVGFSTVMTSNFTANGKTYNHIRSLPIVVIQSRNVCRNSGCQK